MRHTASTLSAGALLLTLGLTACGASPTTNPQGTSNAEPSPSATPEPATPDNATPETQDTVTPPTPDTAAATDSGYRDGEYSATGWYGSLPSHHDVTLTIEAGAVTAVDITTPAEDETSLGYQQRFAAALPDTIVGRNIDELNVDRLAGSSGCSEGFMDALAQIKEQAAA